jgi:hypothetical protein
MPRATLFSGPIFTYHFKTMHQLSDSASLGFVLSRAGRGTWLN